MVARFRGLLAPVVAPVVFPVALAVVVASVSGPLGPLAPLRIALVAVLSLVGVWLLLAPVLRIALLAVVLLLLLLRGALVAVAFAAFGLFRCVRLRNSVGARVLGMRRVAVFMSRSADCLCLLGVWSDRQRRGTSLLLHLLGDMERDINRGGFARPLGAVSWRLFGRGGRGGTEPTVRSSWR